MDQIATKHPLILVKCSKVKRQDFYVEKHPAHKGEKTHNLHLCRICPKFTKTNEPQQNLEYKKGNPGTNYIP